MLDFLMIALLQAVAGEPNASPPASEQPAERAETQTAEQPVAEAAAPRTRTRRVCTEVEVTGNRIPHRTCRTITVPADDERAEQAQ